MIKLFVAIAALLSAVIPARAEQCWDIWQGRRATVSGTVQRVDEYLSGWSIYTSARLSAQCRVVEIYQSGTADPLCRVGSTFTASGRVNANQRTDFLREPDQSDVELRADVIACAAGVEG